jgi:hypothetical protein
MLTIRPAFCGCGVGVGEELPPDEHPDAIMAKAAVAAPKKNLAESHLIAFS